MGQLCKNEQSKDIWLHSPLSWPKRLSDWCHWSLETKLKNHMVTPSPFKPKAIVKVAPKGLKGCRGIAAWQRQSPKARKKTMHHMATPQEALRWIWLSESDFWKWQFLEITILFDSVFLMSTNLDGKTSKRLNPYYPHQILQYKFGVGLGSMELVTWGLANDIGRTGP